MTLICLFIYSAHFRHKIKSSKCKLLSNNHICLKLDVHTTVRRLLVFMARRWRAYISSIYMYIGCTSPCDLRFRTSSHPIFITSSHSTALTMSYPETFEEFVIFYFYKNLELKSWQHLLFPPTTADKESLSC